MAFNLPVQIVIDRKQQLQPFMVLTAFVDDDGQPSVLRHEVGGAHGHHPGDPSPWIWTHPTEFGYGPEPENDWAGSLDGL
jgi:hypothetical protein